MKPKNINRRGYPLGGVLLAEHDCRMLRLNAFDAPAQADLIAIFPVAWIHRQFKNQPRPHIHQRETVKRDVTLCGQIWQSCCKHQRTTGEINVRRIAIANRHCGIGRNSRHKTRLVDFNSARSSDALRHNILVSRHWQK